MSAAQVSGRLSTLAAALVIARRDFTAILFSRSFLFFLLGPLFPLIVGGLAGGIGASVKETTARPELGIAMSKADVAAMSAGYRQVQTQLTYLPDLVVVAQLEPGQPFDAAAAVRTPGKNLAAVITGTPEKPVLTGTRDLIERWQGPVSLADYPAPAVGWPMFFALGVLYFSMGYLLLGSLFLAIGSMASTVREVQTLSMPVTMLQLLNFFFASYAMARPGSVIEIAATVVPFSSPFAMLARAAQDPRLWTHGLALAWQVMCVAICVKAGATLFRKWVMKSGPARGGKKRRWFGRQKAV